MKKTLRTLFLTSLVLCGLAGCASTKQESVGKVETAADDEIDKIVVVDWTDRTLGEVSAPIWLKNLRRGNADLFKEQYGINSDRIVKISMARANTEAAAQALTRSGFAYSQAAELNQKVIGRVGQGLNDNGQLEALYLAASETKVELSGLREETVFYQKIKTTNAITKEVEYSYQYYTVYSMSKESWDNLVKKYLMDIMGGENLETETQKKIGALFTEMKEDADKKDQKKYEEEKRLYDLQMKKIEAETSAKKVEADKEDEIQTAVQKAMDLADFLL